jgi:hypothetical protein
MPDGHQRGTDELLIDEDHVASIELTHSGDSLVIR